MSSSRERLFSFAVIKHPTEEEEKKGERATIVVAPSVYVLARTEQEVVMLATVAIPEEELKHADRLEVAVSPF